MSKPKFVSRELSSILTRPKVLIPIIAVMLIPLIYSSMFLWAFWDPYGKLDQLPVAVVNSDRGAVFKDKPLNVGNDFTEKIKQTHTFKWAFVSKEEAEKGLKDNRYYLAIEIPEDFTEKASQLMNGDPSPAQFRFLPNEGRNFIAAQIGRSGVERMQSEISNQLTQVYTQTVFEDIHTLSEGLVQAAQGAQSLADGSKTVETGIQQVDAHLQQLASGTQPLQSGVSKLQSGAQSLNGGLDQLAQGAGQLSSGLGQLAASQQQLAQGTQQAEAAARQLQTGLAGSADGAAQLQAGSAALLQGLKAYAAAHPDAAADPQLQQLTAAAEKTAAGAQASAGGMKQLAAGAAGLAEAEGQLNAGMATFSGKLGEAGAAGRKLGTGAAELQKGGAGLESGLTELQGGVGKLADGASQLGAGTQKLAEGMGSVVSGSSELSGKLSDASKQTSDLKGSDKLYQTFADPVQVKEDKVNEVPNYGTGFAPYFLSLGLFVGALMLSIVFPFKDPAARPASALRWYAGKTGVLLLVGALQALIADAVLLWGLGIHVQSLPLFFLFSVLTSWTFMAIIQLLVTPLGNPGRFIAVLLLILQLTSCGGSYPVELLPHALQSLSAWLPMNYTLAGFRAIISSGDYAQVGAAAIVLAGIFLVLSAVVFSYFIAQYRRRHTGSKPSQPAALSS